jgi:homoserine dehydrogenase
VAADRSPARRRPRSRSTSGARVSRSRAAAPRAGAGARDTTSPGRDPAAPIRVAILGWGTIGSGVIRLFQERQRELSARLGHPIELARVVDIDLKRSRPVKVAKSLLGNDAKQILGDPKIDVIVELMGGFEPARRFLLEAIANGKDVVTANKALLAKHGAELLDAAEKRGVGFGFEASVGGGIPIIRTLREGLSADRNRAVFGIVNGTSNYILSTMASQGRSFDDVLAAAQREGLAEADPTYDVEGIDAAHKLAILAQLAFGVRLPVDDVHTEGIRHVDATDMAYAAELGYAIKLLAIAKDHGSAVEARVHPTMIPLEHPLASVNGAFNAVCVQGDALGRSMYYGLGAGMMPTATAVVADVLDIARDRLGLGRPRLAPLGYGVASQRRTRIRPMGDVSCEYYLRLQVRDRPGVLARIAGDLGEHGISIASVVQRDRKNGGTVPIVIRTHEARERDLRRALERVRSRASVHGAPVAIRIEPNPG